MPAAQLDPQAVASLNEASVLLQNTTGFMYLPVFAESERAAALALAQLRPAMISEPYRIAWPALRAATLDAKKQKSELDQDQKQLLAGLDEAIHKLPANSVVVLDASSRARSALAERIASHLNLRREPLRAAQLRFVVLWIAPLREALVAGAPDLWSMRSLSPWADEVELGASPTGDLGTLLIEKTEGPDAKTTTQTRQRLENLRGHHRFADADMSIDDALALIHALHQSNQVSDALEVAERLVTELANDTTNSWAQDLSEAFVWVSLLRSTLGDRQGALQPAQEAVSIRRRLAQANPAAYEPNLAASLNNLASFVSELGDRQGALQPAQEAVSIYRRLAQANPAAYEPNLAMSLNNLANFVSELGDRQGALQLAREAVSINRRLAQADRKSVV